MRKLTRFLKQYKLQVIVGPIFKLIEAIFELIVPLVMADIIDIGVKNGDANYIWQHGGILLLLGVVGLASSLTCQTLASVASQGVGTNLRREMFHHINQFSYRDLDKFGTPTLITRMTNDVNQLQVAVAMLIRLVVRAPFLAIGAVFMAMRIDMQLSLIFLLIVPLIALTLYIIMSKSIPFYKVIQKKLDKISLISRENLSGARVVRAFGKQDEEAERFSDASDDLSQQAIRIGRLSALLSPLSAVIMNLGIVAIVWFGGMRVNIGGMTQGQVIAFVNYMTQILLALVVVANMVVIFTKAAASAQRVNEIFDTKPTVTDEGTGAVNPIPGAPKITFQDVFFRYTESGDMALSNAAFAIQPGTTVGIIGGTGSSKSTLINLIPRFYDVTQGNVLIDGVNVKEYPTDQLRNKIGIVPQNATLFSGTIRDNLCWRKKDATDQELDLALRISQAKEFVDQLPQGLDSPVTQGGRNFSGGQRQRLTIARALVGVPEILILDDSASALDFATDAALRKAIKENIMSATVLIVSQRVSTIRYADRIMVLDEGAIVGQGAHQELLQTCQVYKEICLSQLSRQEVENP